MAVIKRGKKLTQTSDSANLQASIPASEAWLFEDKDALASIDKGMTEANNGQSIDKRSFVRYINE